MCGLLLVAVWSTYVSTAPLITARSPLCSACERVWQRSNLLSAGTPRSLA